MQCACTILSSVACPALQYFSTLSHTLQAFRRKKILNIIRAFQFFMNFEVFLILRRIQWDSLEFITNLMHNFIYSIIVLHHDRQHVSSIAVIIFRRTIVYLQYLVSLHSVWQHTECDDTRYCKYTFVLLKMSTAMLETC
jgi:tryptophan-rich sensory protein